MSRRSWMLLLLWCLLGCETSALTEVVITVTAEAGVRARATQTTLVVTLDPAGAASVLHDNRDAPRVARFAQQPYVVALSPRAGSESAVYELEVAALERGQVIASARLISSYVEGQTRYVNITLEDACIDVSCGEQLTCRAGHCVDATVDADQFSAESKGAPRNIDLIDSEDTTPTKPDDADGDAQVPTVPDAPPVLLDPPVNDPGTTPTIPNITRFDAAVPMTRPDAAVPITRPDANVPTTVPDASVPDAGKGFVCTPMGEWIARRDQLLGGTCGSQINDFPVQYYGSISDPMASEKSCKLTPTLSADGCVMTYVHDCLVVLPDDSFIERETGRIEMTSATTMSGTGTVVLLDKDTYADKGCKSSIVLSAHKK